MDNAIGLIDVLKSAPAYLVVFVVAAGTLYMGTSRRNNLTPESRKILNPCGVGLIVVGVLLILWGEITKVIGG